MPLFAIRMGDALTGRTTRMFDVEAEDRNSALTAVYDLPGAAGLIALGVEGGCPPPPPTRNVTRWRCASCGAEQDARRRVCQGCGRRKPPHPKGFGCCGVDWHAAAPRCGSLAHAASAVPQDFRPCGREFCAEDAANLPHPEQTYLTA